MYFMTLLYILRHIAPHSYPYLSFVHINASVNANTNMPAQEFFGSINIYRQQTVQ